MNPAEAQLIAFLERYEARTRSKIAQEMKDDLPWEPSFIDGLISGIEIALYNIKCAEKEKPDKKFG